MLAVLAGFCVRGDLLGVTSIVRALGLREVCYDRILDFFHSCALNLSTLTTTWTALVLNTHPGLLRWNDRLVLVADGIKVPKSGKKMPAVKRLHQASESNSKPEFIMGHSCQAVAILVRGFRSVAAIPLVARISEGLVFSNRDKRTLLDKLIQLLAELAIEQPYYLVADAYYASKKIALPLLKKGNHLVTRVRTTAVGYFPAPPPETKKPGRPKCYGKKVALRNLFKEPQAFQSVDSPVYGEERIQLRLRSLDLLWRPVGVLVRFVAVDHPTRGRCLLMSTDLKLDPVDIVRLYGYRFKIEVAFKQALRVVGAFLYHFWMRDMTPTKRNAGNQYLHRKTKSYRDAIMRKMNAYHRFIQLGLIAQGIMVAIATTKPDLVWRHFGSWIRTIRAEVCPSEMVVAIALRNSLPEFLADSECAPNLTKFIQENLDLERAEGIRLAA
jgi:DDE superfamily endonuclease